MERKKINWIYLICLAILIATYSCMCIFSGAYLVCSNMNSSLYGDYRCYKDNQEVSIDSFQQIRPFEVTNLNITFGDIDG